jgi:hypothetical protein
VHCGLDRETIAGPRARSSTRSGVRAWASAVSTPSASAAPSSCPGLCCWPSPWRPWPVSLGLAFFADSGGMRRLAGQFRGRRPDRRGAGPDAGTALYLLGQRPARFTELQRAIPGISANCLNDRLRDLADENLVLRRTFPGRPSDRRAPDPDGHRVGPHRASPAMSEIGIQSPTQGPTGAITQPRDRVRQRRRCAGRASRGTP